ncbi:MAG: glycosyltransferase family 4 protein [Hyphomicrobiaceae bacterium]
MTSEAHLRAPPRLAVVLKGYPRLSETFIAQELLSLQRRGIDLAIWSLRHPTDARRHRVHDEISAAVHYLPEYLKDGPLRVLRSWWSARRLPGYRRAVTAFRRDFRRDRTANRIRRFGQALVLAAELPSETRWLYVHFLHTPASVTRYAALMRGLGWSASAHAKDIYTTPDWELAEKLDDLDWIVTCTAANVAHLGQLAPANRQKIHLLYHGLDLTRFPPTPLEPRRDQGGPVQILSIGRAVPKKGFDTLLRALARIPTDLSWQFTHAGGGPELRRLEALAVELGITDRIRWLGPRTQDEVLSLYRGSDLFVLASRIADDGDRDGLPNVLMEAQSQALACIATDVSAIPELIRDGENGLLISPDNPQALSAAMQRLIRNPSERRDLGIAGATRIRTVFDHDHAIDKLVERLQSSLRLEPAPDAHRRIRAAQSA